MTAKSELPVCVLGMSRSGTSLTARVLNLLGVDLGPNEDLVPGNEQNVKGYWERREIFDLNEAVLTALGGTYLNPPPLAPGWEHSPELASLERRARELVDACFGASKLWGFKDPRTSLTLPFWRRIVPRMRYVICVRHPLEVAASFAQYPSTGPFHGKDWLDLWLRSTASALLQTNDSPRMLAFYEDFFADLRAEVELLAAFIKRPVTATALVAIEDFVEAGLRHHRVEAEPISPGLETPGAISLYAALRDLPPHPSNRDLKRVDALAASLLSAPDLAESPQPAAPTAVSRFPDDLATPGIAYYGIHQDGWLERESQIALAGGPPATLVVRAQVLPQAGQRLEVLVDGLRVDVRDVTEGPLDLFIPIPAARHRRLVELRWADSVPLPLPDTRRAAAALQFLGFSEHENELLNQGDSAIETLVRERDLQAEAAACRLEEIEKLAVERDLQAKIAAERLEALEYASTLGESLEQLKRELALQSAVAAERLEAIDTLVETSQQLQSVGRDREAAIEKLRTELDLQAEAAMERLATVEKLRKELSVQTAAAQDRLAEIEKLEQALEERLTAVDELGRERDLQAQAAEERLATIEELEKELDVQTAAAEDRLETIAELERALRALEKRAATVDELARERDLQAQAAEERLATIEELEKELDVQTAAAENRLKTIAELEHAVGPLKERAASIDELARERDLQAQAAEERLATIEEMSRERALLMESDARRAEAVESLARKRIQGENPPEGWR